MGPADIYNKMLPLSRETGFFQAILSRKSNNQQKEYNND